MTMVVSSQWQVVGGGGNGNDSGGYTVATGVGYEELVQRSELFWEKLKAFHGSLGTKFMSVHYISDSMPEMCVCVDSGSGDDVSRSVVHDDDAPLNIFPEYSKLIPGCSVAGIIDGKFEGGCLVTVNLGDQQMKGVLYHIPQVLCTSRSQISGTLELTDCRRRRRLRMALHDPFPPKSNRSGYNFFFAEHSARLKPQYYGQERAISKKIGFLWNNLTEAEKQL